MFFAAINIVLSMFFGKYDNATHLDGTTITKSQYMGSIFITVIFSFTFLGFLLGSLLSFIPFKNEPYSKKILFFSLIIILILQVLTTAMTIISMFS